MQVATITPTTLTADELATRIEKQMATYRTLFTSGNPDTSTGSMTVHDMLKPIAAALRNDEASPVVAQIRLIAARRTAARYWVGFDISTR